MSSQAQPAQPAPSTRAQPPAKRKRTRTKRRRAEPVAPEVELKIDLAPIEGGPLAEFFEGFKEQGFIFDPEESPTLEFRRLNRELEIHRDDPGSRELWEAFGMAMAEEFGVKFGKQVDDIRAWQRLCKRIGIEPLPTALEDARTKFKETHVNIVELLTPRIKDGEMQNFETEEELAMYSRKHGLIYPRECVPNGSLLWYLLRHIKVPRRGQTRRGERE